MKKTKIEIYTINQHENPQQNFLRLLERRVAMENKIESTGIQQNNTNNSEGDFSVQELKLLNLIAEIIVNISIRESNEKGN